MWSEKKKIVRARLQKTTIYLSHEASGKAKASIFCRLLNMRKFMQGKGAQCSTDKWPFNTSSVARVT